MTKIRIDVELTDGQLEYLKGRTMRDDPTKSWTIAERKQVVRRVLTEMMENWVKAIPER